MKLGIISKVNEESFISAAAKKLDFVEFCINPGYDEEEFFKMLPRIKEWVKKYNVGVGSIGRWKAYILNKEENIDWKEALIAERLIEAASYLGCGNYICGCNYIEGLSYYENCTRAMEFFSNLIEIGKRNNVKISTYNCRKMNFVHNPVAWTVIHGHLKDLGIKYDLSHAFIDGRDYLKESEDWGDRFRHIHLNGSLIADGQRINDPPAGLKQSDWKRFLSILYSKSYSGGLSIELHPSIWQKGSGEEKVDNIIDYFKSLLF